MSLPDAPDPAPTLSREQVFALLLSVFVVAICGLSYELMMGAVATTLLGSSVIWYSLTIGVFLSAMGVGSWLSRFLDTRLLEWFVGIEILIGVCGGAAGALVFAVYSVTAQASIAMLSTLFVIGALVGIELPLLTRFLEPYGGLRRAISNVMALDYLGALVASLAFPFILLPWLGLMESFFVVGLLNLLAAALTAFAFRDRLPSVAIGGAIALIAAPLAAGLWGSQRMMDVFERRLYADEVVHAEQSSYQRIVLTRFADDLRLYLDGHLQLSGRDEYRYHESLVHPAMALTASRHDVLLLGAGDGLAAREVLAWPEVQSLTIVDLDPAVTALASTHPGLLELNEGALSDPRVTVVNADAFTWLTANAGHWGVIILDFPDPHDDALARLYSTSMYRLVEAHLSPGGVAVTQASSPYFARQAFWSIDATVQAAELNTIPYHAYVPAFGEWGFVLFGRSALQWDRIQPRPDARFVTASVLSTMTRFPPDMGPVPATPSTLDHPTVIEAYRKGWGMFH